MKSLLKNNRRKRIAQGVVEYMLVFVFAAIVIYSFVAKFDFSKLRTFAIPGYVKSGEAGKIVVPPMSE